jgi:hypothetical protein
MLDPWHRKLAAQNYDGQEKYGHSMTQICKKVTDAVDGILNGKRYLIHDRNRRSRQNVRTLSPM